MLVMPFTTSIWVIMRLLTIKIIMIITHTHKTQHAYVHKPQTHAHTHLWAGELLKI